MITKRSLFLLLLLGVVTSSAQAVAKGASAVQIALNGFGAMTTAQRITAFNNVAKIVSKGSFSQADDNAIHNALGVSIAQIKSNPQWKTSLPALNTDLNNWTASGGDTNDNATQLVTDYNTLASPALFGSVFTGGPVAYQNAFRLLTGGRAVPNPAVGQNPPSAASCPTGLDLQAIFDLTGRQLNAFAPYLDPAIVLPAASLNQLGTDAQPAASFATLSPIVSNYAKALNNEMIHTLVLLQGQQGAPAGQIASLANFAYTPNSSLSSMVYQVITGLQGQISGAAPAPQGIAADIRTIFAGGAITMDIVQPLLTGSPDVSLLSVQAGGSYADTRNQAIGIVTAMKQALIDASQAGGTTGGTTMDAATRSALTGLVKALNGLGAIDQNMSITGYGNLTATTPLGTVLASANAAISLLKQTLAKLNQVVTGINGNHLAQITNTDRVLVTSNNTALATGQAYALSTVQGALSDLDTYATVAIVGSPVAENNLTWYNEVCFTLTALPLVAQADASVSVAGTQAKQRSLLSQLIALTSQNQSVVSAARAAGLLATTPAQTIQFTVTIKTPINPNATPIEYTTISVDQTQLSLTNNGNSISYGAQTIQPADIVVITSITLGAPIRQ